jgi:septum formation protein
MRRLILASASPRRRELLALLGLPFEVRAADIDETPPDDREPEVVAMELAEAKARACVAGLDAEARRGALVLGADTIVVIGETILGKPTSPDDARRMLAMLSGATHRVITGMALARTMDAGTDEVARDAVVTEVTFRSLTAAMIDAYLATGEPFDKAGAYGIQERAAPFVEDIRGDYFNVVGLPVQRVARLLEQAGVEWWRGPAALE